MNAIFDSDMLWHLGVYKKVVSGYKKGFGLRARMEFKNSHYGHIFVFLKNTNEIATATSVLNNCLDSDFEQYNRSDIYVIKEGVEYKAVIEVKNHYVYQARLKHNIPLVEDMKIYKTFEQWRMIGKWLYCLLTSMVQKEGILL